MPRDELAEALWGAYPPATWEKALTVLVSKLRGLLAELGIDGTKVLTGAFGCYRLELPKGSWVDAVAAPRAAEEAEAALAAGDLVRAKEAAALAASLVRRPFLPGDEGAWVEERRRELGQIRLQALSVQAEACLRSGDAGEAAKLAAQVVELEPFREVGHRRLMEAHIAGGDRAEALRVYERCRQLLADELGTYPSPETEAVYRSLLATPQSPATEAAGGGGGGPAGPRESSAHVEADAAPTHWRRLLVAAVGGAAILALTSAVLARAVFDQASATPATITFDGVWTGADRTGFERVIAAFNRTHPEIKVKYRSLGPYITTGITKAVAAGRPPDMADLPQPGFVDTLAREGHLQPITYATSAVAKNFAPVWRRLGTYDGRLYALVFKAANKSLLWYNAPAFRKARAAPPKTWSQLLADAKRLDASGVPAYSIGGADGWTLTDLFENVYLRIYGPAKYDALSAHTIKWTDPSVRHALSVMAEVIGDRPSLSGGTVGAAHRDYGSSVWHAFSKPPKAAMVFEGDFVLRQILSLPPAKRTSGFGAVAFPSINPKVDSSAVEIGGDLIVTFRDTPPIETFLKFLATAPAAEAWARLGGFGTGNLNVPASAYPNTNMRTMELPLETAQSVVFDMSDEQPAPFGSTVDRGEWPIFQRFLVDPAQADRTAHQLEVAAAAAYK